MTAATATDDDRPSVVVIDYGAGNLVSVEQALTTVGADVRLVRDPATLDDAQAVVMPGVGAAAPAMDRLARQGLVGPIRDWIASGRPFLGICLGLQLLYEGSDEDGSTTLGVLPGRTRRLAGAPTLPHIGWNQVERRREHPLFAGVPPDTDAYFVHSFVAVPASGLDDPSVLATTEHGRPFVSAVERGALLGVQFHPERSGSDGLRVLSNFMAIVRDLARSRVPV